MKLKTIKLAIISLIFASACKATQTDSVTPIEKSTMETNATDNSKHSDVISHFNIEVASKRVDCYGMVPQKCLLIKEDREIEWTNFYDNIEGFDHESGYEYKIQVKRITLENPPADTSAYRYVLLNVINKEKKDTDLGMKKDHVSFEGVWNLKELYGKSVSQYNANITIKANTISAYSGCNRTTPVSFLKGDNNEMGLESSSPMGSTSMGCPEGHIEDVYFKTLKEIAKYDLSGNRLTLFNKDNKTILIFER